MYTVAYQQHVVGRPGQAAAEARSRRGHLRSAHAHARADRAEMESASPD